MTNRMNQTDLRPFLAAPDDVPKSTTLLREEGLRVLLLHLKSGEEMLEHQTPGAITVQCLTGEVSFFAGKDEVELTGGLLISLAPECPHRLIARQESLLLVTISERTTHR